MKKPILVKIACMLLFAALIPAVSGCASAIKGPRATHEPIIDHTQPPLPDDYDKTEAVVKDQTGNIKYLTSSAGSSNRTKGEVSEAFKAQYAELALRLLGECSDGKSTLISPLSILTALQMTANGAQGSTLDEMMKVLGGNIDRDTMNQMLFNYYESLGSNDDAKFHVANAIWMTDRQDFLVNKGFIDVVDNTFRADVAKAPFTDNATVDAINKWCADNTDDMIPGILDYDSVNENTIMVLLNALCFDALWMEQYEEYQVKDSTFHGVSGNTTVKMMNSKESCYVSGARETGFLKRYRGQYAFVALLPEKGLSVDDYLATLTGEEFVNLMNNRSYDYDVTAGLPKFKYDWDKSLADILKKMGMEKAFDEAGADFSALGTLPGANLFITDVIHKTHIEVDESGTRAAAVTAVMVAENGMPKVKEKKTVVLDRPFVYAIVDTNSMLPIFIGTVTDI